MIKKDLERFFRKVEGSEELQAQIGEKTDGDTLVKLGAEHGCEFTLEELEDVVGDSGESTAFPPLIDLKSLLPFGALEAQLSETRGMMRRRTAAMNKAFLNYATSREYKLEYWKRPYK